MYPTRFRGLSDSEFAFLVFLLNFVHWHFVSGSLSLSWNFPLYPFLTVYLCFFYCYLLSWDIAFSSGVPPLNLIISGGSV